MASATYDELNPEFDLNNFGKRPNPPLTDET